LKPNSVSVSPGPRPGRSEPAAPPPRLGQVPPVEPPAPRPEARQTPPPLRPVPAPRPMTTPEPPRMPAARPGPSTVGPSTVGPSSLGPSSLGPATRGPSTPAPGPAPSSRQAPAADAPPAEGRAPDAAILSDMAKQLEQALKRSPGAGEPPHHPAAARSPTDEPRAQAGRDDRYQDERASRPAPPPPARGATIHDAPPSVAPMGQGARPPLEPVRPEPARFGAVRPEPQRADPPRAPEPMRSESARPAPPPEAPRTEPPRPAPPQPAPPAAPPQPAPPAAAPAPQKRTVDDPFSVEEIEAEFARLLGRPVDKTDNS
jgi:hypothetical protein